MKMLSIIGARPQFVKAAIFRLRASERQISETLLHTGQHFDANMSTEIFNELNIRQPDVTLTLNHRSHGGMTGELLAKIEQQIRSIQPDIVNVYGDTNSTLAGALAAAKLHVPVMHIEAGLRSFNKAMPEEINRILTDHVSSYLFCPTKTAVINLEHENITDGVYHSGDIMLDAVTAFKPYFTFPAHIKTRVSKPIALLTIHRADTLSDRSRLAKIIKYCETYTSTYDVIFPIHPNTQKHLKSAEIDINQFITTSPLSYLEIQGVLKEAELVLTDSGGLQKEAYFHKCDCITLRDETEWLETIDCGWNRLWHTDKSTLKSKKEIKEYGSGNAVNEILDIVCKNL